MNTHHFAFFLFSVVIDRADNPKASTGKFECIYHQTMTRARHYHADNLEIIGSALQPKYFNREGSGSEVTSCNSSKLNGQPHLNILSNLDFVYRLDSDDICSDKGDNKGEEIRTYMTKLVSDAMTELNYIKRSDINPILDMPISNTLRCADRTPLR